MNTLPIEWKSCATCAHWCGRQTPNLACTLVEFDNHETARCSGGGFNGCNMNAMASCAQWNPRFKK